MWWQIRLMKFEDSVIYSGVNFLSLPVIHDFVDKFWATGSVTNEKRRRKHTFLAKGNFNDVGVCLRFSIKNLSYLSQETGTSYSSVQNVTKSYLS